MKDIAIGIDIGGTAVKIGLVGKSGLPAEKWSFPTRTEENGRHIIDDISDSINKKISELKDREYNILGAGVGLPGFVDEDGTAHGSVNLGWTEPFNIEEVLSQKLRGLPVRACNDANAAALAEAWMGSARGYKSMMMVTLGTGIGGGIVTGGQILAGAHSCAGEIGHVCVNRDETAPCSCGRAGCLEQYASAPGLRRLIKEGLNTDMGLEEFWEKVRGGDEACTGIAKRFGSYLGYALSMAAMTVDPEIFVIGGGMSHAGQVILPFIREGYEDSVLPVCQNTPIVLAAMGNDAGIIGAAALALGNVRCTDTKI
ncbi:MAG: ROK family protein [Lachnospiraceae bacterium]|nr:ROK family protein [Lachnospiraceae bacterium]